MSKPDPECTRCHGRGWYRSNAPAHMGDVWPCDCEVYKAHKAFNELQTELRDVLEPPAEQVNRVVLRALDAGTAGLGLATRWLRWAHRHQWRLTAAAGLLLWFALPPVVQLLGMALFGLEGGLLAAVLIGYSVAMVGGIGAGLAMGLYQLGRWFDREEGGGK